MAGKKAREAKEAILKVFRAVEEDGEDKIKIVRERCLAQPITKAVLIDVIVGLLGIRAEPSQEPPQGSSQARLTVPLVREPGERVCKALYNGQPCPDPGDCLFRHPKVCNRPECKIRRDEDCMEEWHAPVCKSVKKLSRCPIGDACTARHPATCDTKGFSTQSGCALWHPKPIKTLAPKPNANSGNATGRTPAGRSNSSGAKNGGKGKGTYVTRQLVENVKMREKIAALEQKREQFCQQQENFPPLPVRTQLYPPPPPRQLYPQQTQPFLLTQAPTYLGHLQGPNHVPTEEPLQDVGGLVAALLPLLQALLTRQDGRL
jgi:hypothetical protein